MVDLADRLRHPDVHARSESGLWVDLNREPLLAYFGLRWIEIGGQTVEIFDGIPVVITLLY